MEEDFIVRTSSEGTIATPEAAVGAINESGCARFKDRLLGKVTIIVEKVDGTITKDTIRWAPDNDPKFNAAMDKAASTILAACRAAVDGGGNDEDIRVKFVAKK